MEEYFVKYDYLIVGSGLYGAVFAHEAKKAGKSVLVIDKRPNIAGNVYTEEVEGIHVHKYGISTILFYGYQWLLGLANLHFFHNPTEMQHLDIVFVNL